MIIKLENRIPNKIQEIVKAIVDYGRISYRESIPYLVGGGVIDIFECREPKDWDIEVFNRSIDELESILSPFGEVNAIGKKFGILKLKVENLDLEFSIPRTENKIGVGHQDFNIWLEPEMSIVDAAKRRDFTVNAIYLNLVTGKIEDPFGGRKDLRRSLLDIVSPDTFIEDPLRCFRAMRFVSYRTRTSSLNLRQLCSTMIEECKALSSDSIFQEWNKMLLKGNRPDRSLRFLRDSNLIKLYPEIENLINCEQSPTHHREGNVFNHSCLALQSAASLRNNLPEEWRLPFMWAALLHDIGKPSCTKIDENGKIKSIGHDVVGAKMARQFMLRLTNSETLINKVELLVKHHMKPITYNDKTRLYKWRQLHNEIPLNILAYFTLADSMGRIADEPFNLRFDKTMKIWEQIGSPEGKIKSVLTGQDLINIGLTPGIHFGEILEKAYQFQIINGIDNKEELIKRLRNEIGKYA